MVIGKDTRLSGYMIEPALVAGFAAAGMDVLLFGPLPTPGVAMMTRSMRADLGVMISASHNAYRRQRHQAVRPGRLQAVGRDRAEDRGHDGRGPRDGLAASDELGRVKRIDDAQARYIEIAKATFRKRLTLAGLRIVIDCANGAAYKVAPDALYELGAEVFPVGVEPNGININEDCGSTHPAGAGQGGARSTAPTSASRSTATPTGRSSATRTARSSTATRSWP